MSVFVDPRFKLEMLKPAAMKASLVRMSGYQAEKGPGSIYFIWVIVANYSVLSGVREGMPSLGLRASTG